MNRGFNLYSFLIIKLRRSQCDSTIFRIVKPYKYRIFNDCGIIKFGIPMLIPLLIKYAIDGVINNGTLTTNEKFHHLAIAIGITLFIF